jgi:hypothetical protein
VNVFVGDLYYYSDVSASMGMNWLSDVDYVVKVQTNTVDQDVFAYFNDTDTVWYNQPDLFPVNASS